MKNYLLVFDETLEESEEIEEILNAIQDIVDWRSDLPFAYYIKSDKNAECLSDQVTRLCPAEMAFIITEITSNSSGSLEPAAWDFMASKVVAG
jgi:hypothetical protein